MNTRLAFTFESLAEQYSVQTAAEMRETARKIQALEENLEQLRLSALADVSNVDIALHVLRMNPWYHLHPCECYRKDELKEFTTIFRRGDFRLLVKDADEHGDVLLADGLPEEEFKQLYIKATAKCNGSLDTEHCFTDGECDYCLFNVFGDVDDGEFIGAALLKCRSNGDEDGVFTVPDSIRYKGKEIFVQSIAPDAFSESGAKTIVLPRYLHDIRPYAFADCAVEHVVFVQKMYDPDDGNADMDEDLMVLDAYGLFSNCRKLVDITADNSVISELLATSAWFMLPETVNFISTSEDFDGLPIVCVCDDEDDEDADCEWHWEDEGDEEDSGRLWKEDSDEED